MNRQWQSHPQSRNKILEGIKELNRKGSTIIYTSHYMEEVEQICTKISILDRGKCLATGTKEELKRMVKTGQRIVIDTVVLNEKQIEKIRTLPHVFSAVWKDQRLMVHCTEDGENRSGFSAIFPRRRFLLEECSQSSRH